MGNIPHFVGSKRGGSTLILAVIFTTLLTLVSGALLARVVHERKTMEASAENASLLYLAEGYAEKAMWEIGQGGDWSGWQSRDGGNLRYIDAQVASGGKTNQVRVLAEKTTNNNNAEEWTIHAEAGTRLASGRILNRQLMIDYAAEVIGKESDPDGVLSKFGISLSGQVEIYAYDSRVGPPGPSNRLDQVTVATINDEKDAFVLSGQVDIYGFAGTGGSKIEVSGNENKILGEESDPSKGNVDWSRVFNDFSRDFPEPEQPNWKANGVKKKLPNAEKGVITLGDPLDFEPQVYDIDKLDVGDEVIRVQGPVVMRVSKDGVSVGGGKGFIEVVGNGSAELYTVGDVTISGQGLVNKTNRPKNLKIFGTNKGEKDHTVSISGDGFMAAVVYAPNAIINMSGDGTLAGSVTGYEIKQSGDANIYYDVSLGEDPDAGVVGNPRVAGWFDVSTDPYPIASKAAGFNSNYSY